MILLYARVSSAEQVEGSSLSDQEQKTRAVAQLRGAGAFDVSSYVDEGVSGSVPLSDRPEGGRMLRDAKEGDCVIVAKLDRAFRSALDALQTVDEFKRRKIDLILLDVAIDPISDSAVGRLFLTLLSAFAEFERARIEERTTDGRKAKRAQNGHLGGQPPYGYRKVGDGKAATLQINPDEQVVIERVVALKHKAPVAICRELEALGFRTRAGTTFLIPQVQKMLERNGARLRKS